MTQDFSIIIVDNDSSLLKSLKDLITRHFPGTRVLVSEDGEYACELIGRDTPDIVLSGLAAAGLNSLELCQRIRSDESLADTYFIILTSNPDKTFRIKMLEEGANDYLVKPLSPEEVISKIITASKYIDLKRRLIEQNNMLNEIANELESNLYEMTNLAVKYIQSRIPLPAEAIKRISDASVWVASKMGETDTESLRDIEIAAYLCHTGKMFLPDFLVKTPVMINGRVPNNLMYQVPVSANDIVSSVRRFKDVGKILYHLYENFDGSGFPGRLKSWQIPLGARIIRVVVDYEDMKYISGYNSREAVNMLRREEKRLYDYKVVTHFEQFIALHTKDEPEIEERIVNLQDLQPGMVVTRDVMTVGGLKLLPSGAVLREGIIEKLLSHNAADPILGSLIIKA